MQNVLIVLSVLVAIGVVAFVVMRLTTGSAPGTLTERDEARPIDAEPAEVGEPADSPVVEETAVVVEEPPASFATRLGRARSTLATALSSIRGRGRVDAETWDELEEALIRADVGVELAVSLLEATRERAATEKLSEPEEVIDVLKAEIVDRLTGDVSLATADEAPTIWLFVGVNGVGKTTTIGKVAAAQGRDGRRVVLAAGDTFRAAAAEQLGMWAERSGATLVRGDEGSDPSSVIFDSVAAAAASDADLVLADTAGRLHTKSNLMEELAKVRRVADKGAGTVTEVLLVLDATTGQNGLSQAKEFAEAADLTGVVLTKLDGSAKGGIVLAIADTYGLPVKLVGLGEGIDDLVVFSAEDFVDALFDSDA